jgi:hypothetical protein
MQRHTKCQTFNSSTTGGSELLKVWDKMWRRKMNWPTSDEWKATTRSIATVASSYFKQLLNQFRWPNSHIFQASALNQSRPVDGRIDKQVRIPLPYEHYTQNKWISEQSQMMFWEDNEGLERRTKTSKTLCIIQLRAVATGSFMSTSAHRKASQ